MKRGATKNLRVGCSLFAIFLFCAFALLPQPAQAQTVVVGSYPWGVAITPNGAYVYVTNQDWGTVSVISTATNTVTTTVHVGNDPKGVAITPNGAYAYVTNTLSSTVSVISTSVLVAPTVTATPGTVDQGQNSSLTSSSVTTGTSPYTYQWLAEAPDASSYSWISGATSSNYSFATTGSTNNGTWSFELQVTDNIGQQVTSNATSVTVNIAPTARIFFSAVDWLIVVTVIIIVLLFIILAWYRHRRKSKTQRTQTT